MEWGEAFGKGAPPELKARDAEVGRGLPILFPWVAHIPHDELVRYVEILNATMGFGTESGSFGAVAGALEDIRSAAYAHQDSPDDWDPDAPRLEFPRDVFIVPGLDAWTVWVMSLEVFVSNAERQAAITTAARVCGELARAEDPSWREHRIRRDPRDSVIDLLREMSDDRIADWLEEEATYDPHDPDF